MNTRVSITEQERPLIRRTPGRAAPAVAFMLGVVALLVLSVGAQAAASTGGQRAANASPSTLYQVRVNAGGGVVTDSLGNVWAADQAYTPGSWGYVGGSTFARSIAISGTAEADWPLYQDMHIWYGVYNGDPYTGTYLFDVPNGVYSVELKFAEITYLDTQVYGYRYEDVLLEGIPHLCMMDVVSAVGRTPTAYDWTFPITVTDGQLKLDFVSHPAYKGVNQPVINAIRVTQLESYTRPYRYPYQRIGLGINYDFGDIYNYDVAAWHTGWYLTWSLRPVAPHPNNIEFVQLINTRDFNSVTYDWAFLNAVIENNPGSVFIIGNEMEGNYQGNHTPAQFADIYGSLYAYIKTRDATAKVAVGGVTMASPARLRWLDAVLAAYNTLYGTALPADIWTVHDQTLGGNEVNFWPVGLPVDSSIAEYHSWICGESGAFDDINRFKSHTIAFRQWMADRGYRNTPMWNSEYGVLAGAGYLCTEKVIGDYLRATMEWMNNATDANIGLPEDGNKLVQRWLWYSLNDQPYNSETGKGFAGAVCYHGCPYFPGAMTGVGRALRDWVDSITPPPEPPSPTPTRTATATATATATRTPLPESNGRLIGAVQLQGRGAAPAPAWSVPMTVNLYLPGDTIPVYQLQATTNESGYFMAPATQTPGIYPGTYNVKMKNPQMLQVSAADVPFTNETPTVLDFGVLKVGDANNDNKINIQDFSLLSSSYSKSVGQAGYDARTDFNGSGNVNIQDFSLLSSNYYQVGMQSAGDVRASGPNLQGSATIRFQPAAFSLLLGLNGNLEVWVVNATAAINGVEAYFTYPSAYLLCNSITPASGWTSPIQPTCANGAGQFSFGLLGSTTTGTFKVATISFKGTALGSGSAIAFSGGTCVSDTEGNCASPLTMQSAIATVSNPPTATRTPTICAGCPTNTPTATPAPLNLGVNCGGQAYTDGQGQLWYADKAYVAGSWGYVDGAGNNYSTSEPIAGTTDDTLYQSEHYGMTQYKFDVAPGTYSVTLKFAEIYYGTAAGKRIFSVKAEGVPVVSNLDLMSTVGRYVAYDVSFYINVTDSQLNLEFTASVGQAKVNAIRVVYNAGETATATPTATQPPPASPTATSTPTATPTPRDAYEPNDTFEQATNLTPNSNVVAYIEGVDDVDYYAFTVNNPSALIWAALTNLPADYDLYLHAPDQSLVAWSNSGGTSPEYILNYPVNGQTGLYYLRVVGYQHAFDSSLPYDLRLELRTAAATATPTRSPTATPTVTPTRPALDPYEPNNSFDQATALSAGVAYLATMDSVSDVDYYKFMISATGKLVSISLTQLPADYDLYLADPARNVVAMSRYGGMANEYLFYTAPSAGVYYVYVVGFNHAYDPFTTYRLMVLVN